MVVYFELMDVWDCENCGRVFLWVVCNIKVLVTVSYVMRKCRTDVFTSVFCNARGSMDIRHDGECPRDNAVSWYFLEIPHFTLLGEAKVFKNNVWNIYSASPKLCIRITLKISYIQIYTRFLTQIIHLFEFFHFSTISWQSGFLGVFAC